MNILYVITKSERGGAQQHVRDLAIGFRDAGNTVSVVSGEKDGWLSDELHAQSIPVESVRLPRTWNPFVFVLYLFDLFRVIHRVHPNIVHFHSSHTLIGTWLVRLCFPRIRSVVTIHGLSLLYPDVAGRWIQSVYGFFLKTVLFCADQVICVSRFDLDVLCQRKLVHSNRVLMIHNGIDAPTFLSRREAQSHLGLDQDVIVIGTLARFSYPKNLSLLLDAFAAWNHPIAKLCLIGSGPEEFMLKQHVQDRQMEDRVVFAAGNATLLKAFTLFVLPSRYEGFPYVLLEAALAEVPIIATNVGGISELIEQNKTGWLVPSGDVDALVQSIEDVVTHPDQASVYAQAVHDRVQNHFSKSIMIKKIQEVYALLQ